MILPFSASEVYELFNPQLTAAASTALGGEDDGKWQNNCVRNAVLIVETHIDAGLKIDSDFEITPAPSNIQRQLIRLMGEICACRIMRAHTADAFSFSSGDKKVDKTKTPAQWKLLEDDLMAEYRRLLAIEKPDSVALEDTSEDPYVITPKNLGAVMYEQGHCLEADCVKEPPVCGSLGCF